MCTIFLVKIISRHSYNPCDYLKKNNLLVQNVCFYIKSKCTNILDSFRHIGKNQHIFPKRSTLGHIFIGMFRITSRPGISRLNKYISLSNTPYNRDRQPSARRINYVMLLTYKINTSYYLSSRDF